MEKFVKKDEITMTTQFEKDTKIVLLDDPGGQIWIIQSIHLQGQGNTNDSIKHRYNVEDVIRGKDEKRKVENWSRKEKKKEKEAKTRKEKMEKEEGRRRGKMMKKIKKKAGSGRTRGGGKDWMQEKSLLANCWN